MISVMAQIPGELCEKISTAIGKDKCSTSLTDRKAHAQDASFHSEKLPDIVVWPESTTDVAVVMKVAAKTKTPVTARAGASSLEGNPIPVNGGIVLDMMRMNSILDVWKEDFQVRVQPGIVGDAFNASLKEYGLTFPAVPGSANVATVGGMIVNNAGGMQAVKYGVVGDWVLKLTIVLADGSIIEVGSRSFKSVAGYDLKRLFIGSEGTLGIITEAVVKVAPLPKYKTTVLASFPTVEEAGAAIQQVLYGGFEPASLELMDSYNVHLINMQCNTAWEELPTIIVEFHDRKPKHEDTIRTLSLLLKRRGGTVVQIAIDDESRMAIWKARWSVRPAIRKFFPQLGIVPGDIGIPLSKIPDYLHRAQELSGKYAVKAVTFGHAGDGNFHTWILYNQSDPDALKRAKHMGEDLVLYALSVGGTCTGEHGVGIGKRKYLKKEHSSSVAWMRKIKQLFDPSGILNPGKIFEE